VTRDYSIIVPLMISNLISYYISSRLQPEPIYEALQHQDGIHLPTGARQRASQLLVRDAMQPAQALPASLQISQAGATVEGGRGAGPVVDEGGLRGIVALEQLRKAMEANRGEETLAMLVPAPAPREQLTSQNFPHLHSDHTLDAAMRKIAECGLPVLPVVSRANVRELKGTISLDDILAAYRISKGSPED
jgi:CIC family chloride channel protein